jgi:hypothetical protein
MRFGQAAGLAGTMGRKSRSKNVGELREESHCGAILV